MQYLLDTDTCSFIMRQSNTTLLKTFHDIPDNAVGMSVISQGELLAGLTRKPLATQLKARFTKLCLAVPVLALPTSAAMQYGSLRAHLEQKGKTIGGNDLWIAAHALALGLTLVTNNTREFARVSGLKLENWVNP
jgi:tRNA(fMet)-specific endonuclease VapC